jgi:hypothetical protein
MALSSRQKQAAWRTRQAANKARLSELERAIADTTERMEQFVCNSGALLFGLTEEAGNPIAVRTRAKQLQEQVDALALGGDLPALVGVDKRRADLMWRHAIGAWPADDQDVRQQLRSMT